MSTDTISDHQAAYERIKQAAQTAKPTTFAELPLDAQKSLAYYMAFDGEAWAEVWDHLDSAKPGMDEALPWLLEHYGGYPIVLINVATQDLKLAISDPEGEIMIEGEHASYDELHEWYGKYAQWHCEGQARGKPKSGTEYWPVILDFDNSEILQDGWHRFHQYVNEGLTQIPCLHYPDDEASRAVQRTMGSSV